MNIEELRKYCLSKPFVTESFLFDTSTLTFKVGGKLFALTELERLPWSINLKCDPERALYLRSKKEAITPGLHMDKKHWNTVKFLRLSTVYTKDLVDHSYDLVLNGLTKEVREALK